MSSDAGEPSTQEEPGLAVRPPPVPFFRRRRFLRAFTPVASLAVAGLIALLVVPESPLLLLPFKRLVTLTGSMGTQYHFFEDERVRELLLRHHIRVNVIRQGTIDAVTGDLHSLDFVFASGQPGAEFLVERRRAVGEYFSTHRPFVSPIVLATYRDYAETLRAAGLATPQAISGFDQPLYYDLKMDGFLDLVDAKKSWKDLNGDVGSRNQVLAQTTSVCGSNGGATYVGLVSYVVHGRAPSNEEAADFATKIKPLISAQGLPPIAPETYFLPEGRQIAPIIVLYEHQYLAHQLNRREQSGQLDVDRVLLYPDVTSQAQAVFVALNGNAAKLGDLLVNDPHLRKRALELGQQVLPSTRGISSEELSTLLAERGVPVPSRGDTRVVLPDVPQLKTMISIVGDCPPAGPT